MPVIKNNERRISRREFLRLGTVAVATAALRKVIRSQKSEMRESVAEKAELVGKVFSGNDPLAYNAIIGAKKSDFQMESATTESGHTIMNITGPFTSVTKFVPDASMEELMIKLQDANSKKIFTIAIEFDSSEPRNDEFVFVRDPLGPDYFIAKEFAQEYKRPDLSD